MWCGVVPVWCGVVKATTVKCGPGVENAVSVKALLVKGKTSTTTIELPVLPASHAFRMALIFRNW